MIGFSSWHRRRVKRRPFPAEWLRIIETNVPYYGRLPPEDREELVGHIQVFLAEKLFEGCGGLQLTDEIRVTIAAQACILLLHRKTDYYPGLSSILVYPHAYVARSVQADEGWLVHERMEPRSGESWGHGIVVLSWEDVRKGASDIHDGRNVVLHEFAHQLDQQDGASDGAPVLPRASMYVAWARVLGREYDSLLRAIKRQHPTLIDRYGGTNPAEFFAVITETFFEKPVEMQRRHPELYDQLKAFYQQDPASLMAVQR